MADVKAQGPSEIALDPGASFYTSRTLRFYDLVVHRVSNRLLWRCPTECLVDHYDNYLGARHLDVGPGTGLLLERARFPVGKPELTLLDANDDVLAYAARRLARHAPMTVKADVRRPLPLGDLRFDSIGLGYVLHCLPPPMSEKETVLQRFTELLSPGGVVFGSTILANGVRHTRRSRAVMNLYNRKGVFGNADDGVAQLEAGMDRVFSRFELEVVGAVALFAGWARSAG